MYHLFSNFKLFLLPPFSEDGNLNDLDCTDDDICDPSNKWNEEERGGDCVQPGVNVKLSEWEEDKVEEAVFLHVCLSWCTLQNDRCLAHDTLSVKGADEGDPKPDVVDPVVNIRHQEVKRHSKYREEWSNVLNPNADLLHHHDSWGPGGHHLVWVHWLFHIHSVVHGVGHLL